MRGEGTPRWRFDNGAFRTMYKNVRFNAKTSEEKVVAAGVGTVTTTQSRQGCRSPSF